MTKIGFIGFLVFGITDLTTYIIGTFLIVLLPGPNSLYVMSIASRYGIKTGYMGALGIFTGDLILMLCTVLGAASLLKAFPWVLLYLNSSAHFTCLIWVLSFYKAVFSAGNYVINPKQKWLIYLL